MLRRYVILCFDLSELFGLALLAPVLTLGLRWVLLRDRLVSGAALCSLGREPDSKDSKYIAAAFLLNWPDLLGTSTAPRDRATISERGK